VLYLDRPLVVVDAGMALWRRIGYSDLRGAALVAR
jgi:hypothetical protein